MVVYETLVDPSSEGFRNQRLGMLALLDSIRVLEQRTVDASARAAPLF